MPFIPRDRFAESLAEAGSGGEAELRAGPTRIEAATRLAVGFGRVPADRAFETGELANLLCQLADGNFLTGAEVDRGPLVVVFGSQGDPSGRVANEEKFAGRGAGPPDFEVVEAGVTGCDRFTDQCRDHVTRFQVEVLAGTVEVGGQERDRV